MTSQVRRYFAVVAALLMLPALAMAQNPVTITGTVTSDAGEPLRLANVSIAELNIVAYTNPDGGYRLVVPGARANGQQVALRARMIGFRSATANVTLTSGSTITQNFQLASDPLRLEEVVVTGAGTEALAERLGTARASVDAATVVRANEPNMVTALAGKVPSVVVSQGSGDAGGSSSIQIRGAKTFGTSQPVFIVDGVPISNANTALFGAFSGPPSANRAFDINPDDIESIEILKGAAATSIYGASAGSAGAILITTKRGRAGRNQYSLRSTYQSDKPVATVPYQATHGLGTGGVSPSCQPYTGPINCSVPAGQFFSWGPALAPGTPTYDHMAEVFETGTIFDNTLSMSGGSDRTTFYLSGGALNHDGFIITDNDVQKRYTVRANGAHSLFESLTLSASGSYVHNVGEGIDRGNALNGIGLSAGRQPPEFDAINFRHPDSGLHRSWRFPNPGPTAFTTNRGFDNPFYAINNHELTNALGRIYGNVGANWRALPWLQINYTLGADYGSDDRTIAYDQAGSGLSGGYLERRQFYDRIIDHNLNATGSWTFSPNMSGSLTVGQNLNENYFRQIWIWGNTFIAPKPFKLANLTSRDIPSDAESRRRVEGYFAQANLDMYDQLFLQARIRNDGNSAFGVDNQRATYPGGSIAWSFTKAFPIAPDFLSFGKLRFAYGESGQQPPLYVTQDIFTTAAFADFNPGSLQRPSLNGIGGLYASAGRGNPLISPERVREYETGVDLNFFGGRTDFSATYYSSKSEDIIFGVTLPPSTGYSSVQLNAGELSNRGWELSTSLRPVQRPDFAWEIGANWARNRNLVTHLGMIDAQRDPASGVLPPTKENCGPTANVPRCEIGFGSSFGGQSTHAQIGYPVGVWRSTDFARCGRGLTTVSFAGSSHDVGAACTGQPDGALYIAADGFPIRDPNTRAIGNPWPDWTAGLNTEINFRGVQLSAFLDHRQGGNVLNMTRTSMNQYGTHKDTELRGQTRTFGQNMLCHNITCDVLNGPVVGPGAGTAVVIGQGWFSGAGATGPAALGSGQGNVGGPISQRIEDGTFTRLREISIGYSIRDPWVQRLAGTRQIDLKLSGRNLKLWSDYSGTDPETNLGGSVNSNRGIDWWNPPLARGVVISVGLHH